MIPEAEVKLKKKKLIHLLSQWRLKYIEVSFAGLPRINNKIQ